MVAPLTLALSGCVAPPPEPPKAAPPPIQIKQVEPKSLQQCRVRAPFEALQQAGLHPRKAQSVVFNLSIGVYHNHFDTIMHKMLSNDVVKKWMLEDLACTTTHTQPNATFKRWLAGLTEVINSSSSEEVLKWLAANKL
ncbi:MAG: hypothetical protein HQL53_06585 [Magnetococcales bacterium]|nr:hypothetical protein [Magnetococcales bacterium]